MPADDTRRPDSEERLAWDESSTADDALIDPRSEDVERQSTAIDDQTVRWEDADETEADLAGDNEDTPVWPEYTAWSDETQRADDADDATAEMPTWAQPATPLPAAPISDRPGVTVMDQEETDEMDQPTTAHAQFTDPPSPSDTQAGAERLGERLPLLHQPRLAEIDPTLYEYWREHIHQGFQRNNRMFDTILDAFMRPYNTTIWMYRILFGLGIAAFLVAAGLGAWLREPMFSLIFGGLSIISFLTYFIGRPLQALEENLKFITWLGIIYNTYWTRLVYMMDSETIHEDLDDATQDAINEIERLLDKHHTFSGNRPGLR